MPIVNYSPWNDAAQFGQGVSNSLAELLVRLPQLRAQQVYQQQELALQGQRLDIERELAKTHQAAYTAQAEHYRLSGKQLEAKTEETEQANKAREELGTHMWRSEEHTSELQSLRHLVCRLLLEKKKQ